MFVQSFADCCPVNLSTPVKCNHVLLTLKVFILLLIGQTENSHWTLRQKLVCRLSNEHPVQTTNVCGHHITYTGLVCMAAR